MIRFSALLLLLVSLLITPPQARAGQDDYLVGAGDVLKIAVYDNPDLSAVCRINTDGSVQFPLIGTVPLAGLTVDGATRRIEGLLADGYLVNPQVSVFIEEYRSKKVVIIGHVTNPGVYELSGPTGLLELISMSGGLRENAGDMVTINRKLTGSEQKQQIIRINLQKLLETGDPSLNVLINDKDSVFIAKAGMFYVTGEVEKPDSYKLEEGTTVLKAISMSGGFTKIAAKNRVRIVRIVDGEEQIMEKVSMQEPLLPDDVIVVPESFF